MGMFQRLIGHRAVLITVALLIGVIGAWSAFESGFTQPEPLRDDDVLALRPR